MSDGGRRTEAQIPFEFKTTPEKRNPFMIPLRDEPMSKGRRLSALDKDPGK